MNKIYIPYREARNLIKEADVLLFRPKKREKWYSLPSAGLLIAKYTGGEHSHVGLAAIDRDRVMLVEFREWYGGRSIYLSNEVVNKSGLIDVYRVLSSVTTTNTDVIVSNNETKYILKNDTKVFTNEIAYNVTSDLYKLTGLQYGWPIIFKLFKAYLPGIRLITDKHKFDNNVDENIYVCSTAVSYVFRKNYIDPVPGISDSYVKPSDLAQSPLFQYQFTLVK